MLEGPTWNVAVVGRNCQRQVEGKDLGCSAVLLEERRKQVRCTTRAVVLRRKKTWPRFVKELSVPQSCQLCRSSLQDLRAPRPLQVRIDETGCNIVACESYFFCGEYLKPEEEDADVA